MFRIASDFTGQRFEDIHAALSWTGGDSHEFGGGTDRFVIEIVPSQQGPGELYLRFVIRADGRCPRAPYRDWTVSFPRSPWSGLTTPSTEAVRAYFDQIGTALAAEVSGQDQLVTYEQLTEESSDVCVQYEWFHFPHTHEGRKPSGWDCRGQLNLGLTGPGAPERLWAGRRS